VSELEAHITVWLTTPRAEATRAPAAGESRADLGTAELRAEGSRVDLERSALAARTGDGSGVVVRPDGLGKGAAGARASADGKPSSDSGKGVTGSTSVRMGAKEA
jgi:hypothetical protein